MKDDKYFLLAIILFGVATVFHIAALVLTAYGV